MPNWCSNRVTFASEDHDTIDFIRGAMDSSTPFQILRPEPDWRQTPNEKGWLPGPKYLSPWSGHYFPDGTIDDRWYGWRLAHWGTKWDIDEAGVDCTDDMSDFLEYEFLTAWGPPSELCLYLREKFEDLDITWFYDEPGMAMAGYL